MPAQARPFGPRNVDRIAGFVHGGDVIALDRDIFVGLAPGDLRAKFFHAGKTAHDHNDHL